MVNLILKELEKRALNAVEKEALEAALKQAEKSLLKEAGKNAEKKALLASEKTVITSLLEKAEKGALSKGESAMLQSFLEKGEKSALEQAQKKALASAEKAALKKTEEESLKQTEAAAAKGVEKTSRVSPILQHLGGWAKRNPKAAATIGVSTGVIGYSKLNDQSVPATVNELLFNNEGVGKDAIDLVGGKGATEQLVGAVDSTVDKISDATDRLQNAVTERYHRAMSPQTAFMQDGYDPYGIGAPELSGNDSSWFTRLSSRLGEGMSGMVSNLTGNGLSGMNIASMIMAAYMMFGRFGWMGKAVSLLLGNYALSSMRNNVQQPALAYRPNQQYQRDMVAATLLQEETENEDNNIIMRHRI